MDEKNSDIDESQQDEVFVSQSNQGDQSEISWQPMHENYAWCELFRTLTSQGIVLGGIVAALSISGITGLSVFHLVIIASVLYLLQLGFSFLGARRTFYAVNRDEIHLRYGIFWLAALTIPFNRIQHVDLSSGPITRLFEIATLRLYTAGSRSVDLTVAGLSDKGAAALRDYILEQITSEQKKNG